MGSPNLAFFLFEAIINQLRDLNFIQYAGYRIN